MSTLVESRIAQHSGDAVIWRGQRVSHAELLARIRDDRRRLREAGVVAGDVVALIGDFSPGTTSLLFAAIEEHAILVPLTRRSGQLDARLATAEVRFVCAFDDGGEWTIERRDVTPVHPLLRDLAARNVPGLVVFTSGSTGASKAIVHDLGRMLERFATPRRALRVLTFLLLDHLGGIHTLLHTLLHGGAVITVEQRTPDAICTAIAEHRVQLLPTSPTFLTMLLLSGAYERYDLSSLELVSYGTEVMPATTLARLRAVLPVRTLQTYGLTETCTIPTHSRTPDSVWVRVGGEGFDVRIVDGRLQVRSRYAMLGYLDARSPFDADGWLDTQDHVLVDGEYVRILGRDTDVINVGGEKVHPSEVEAILGELDNIADATVFGHPSPVTGQIVAARLVLYQPEEAAALRQRVRAHCQARLPRFKIPARVEISEAVEVSERFKKRRSS